MEKIRDKWREYKDKGRKWLLAQLPDEWFGSWQHLAEAYQEVLGRIPEAEIQKERSKNLNRYLATLGGLVLCVLLTAVGSAEADLETLLKRPAYQEAPRNVSLLAEAQLEQAGATWELTEETVIQVQPSQLTKLEQNQRLEQVAGELEHLVLGQTNQPTKIIDHLNLPDLHPSTGVAISWNLDEAPLVREDGLVRFLEVERPQAVTLRAHLRLEDAELTKVFTWLVYPVVDQQVLARDFSRRVREMSAELSENQEGVSLAGMLDQQSAEGADNLVIQWRQPEKSRHVWGIILLFIALAGAVYQGRYRGVKQQLHRYREQVEEDIPDMVNEFVLLMNAGLVAQSAFRFMADVKGPGENRPLFRGIQDIVERVERSNTSFIKEFILFSRRTQSRELMRFASILADNIGKGSALVEKLEVERELLWSERKKRAEVKAKEAETKLAAPLLLLLLSLVVITVAPAIMEM